MIETAEIAPQRRPVRWRRWLMAALVLLILGTGVFLMWLRDRGGPRLRLVNPSAGASVHAGPLPVEVAPELAAAGLKAEYLGQSSQMDQTLFFRRENFALLMEITAGREPVAPGDLRYALIDGDGTTRSEGTVDHAALQPGAQAKGSINDGELPNTRRVLIRK